MSSLSSTTTTKTTTLLDTTTVCRQIQSALDNMGRALRCPLCLSTLQNDPVVLSHCAHAYCRSCLLSCLKTKSCCPTCQQACTKRQVQSDPLLKQLTVSYHKTLRHFGLTPLQYTEELPYMTQLPLSQSRIQDLAVVHRHVQASRTFCKALADNPKEAPSWAVQRNNATTKPTESLQQQHQRAVVQANERALLRAVVQKQQRKVAFVGTEPITETGTKDNTESIVQDKRSASSTKERTDKSETEFRKATGNPSTAAVAAVDANVTTAAAVATTTTTRQEEALSPPRFTVTPARGKATNIQRKDPPVDPPSLSQVITPTVPIQAKEPSTQPQVEPRRVSTCPDPTATAALTPPANTAAAASIPTAATTSTAVQPKPTPPQPHTEYKVGDLVQVQSRTWPGMNKPGGVGKITRIQGQCMDVAYVLGGKEHGVEAVFCSPHAFPSPRIKQPAAANAILPQPLLEQLEAEGFDVNGGSHGRRSTQSRGRSMKRPFGSAANKPKRSLKKEKTKGVNNTNSKNNTKKRPRSATASAPSSRKRPKIVGQALKATCAKLLGTCKQPSKPPTTIVAPSVPRGAAKQHTLADERYESRINAALQQNVLYVVASQLAEDDLQALHALVKETRAAAGHSNNVVMKLSSKLSRTKTTLVVTTASGSVAAARTLKTMQACLAGIPMVSAAWIHTCRLAHRVLVPEPSMYIRTLPTKNVIQQNPTNSKKQQESLVTTNGVAYTAAALESSPHFAPLTGWSLYFANSLTADTRNLTQHAGADVLTRLPKKQPTDRRVVTIATKANPKLKPTVVVHPQWIYDSVSKGQALPVEQYAV